MAGTLALSGACLIKAGTNVDSYFTGASAETNWVNLINQAESYLNVLTRYNWIDNYATLNSDVKLIAEEAVSNLAAIYAIQYSMWGYTSIEEAEDMVNILWARFNQCAELLKEQVSMDFVKAA